MIIPGISIACFAALSTSSFPLIHRVICFPWLWSSDSMSYIRFNIGWFSLLFSTDSIELSVSVYITQLMSSFFCISLIAVISAVWMEASSGSTPYLVMSVNTAAKPSFLPILFDLSVYEVLRSFAVIPVCFSQS